MIDGPVPESRMTKTILLIPGFLLGCAAHLPVRTEITAQHPTKTISLRATPEEEEIVDVASPVEDDAWRGIRIVVLYPRDVLQLALELNVKDSARIAIETNVFVTCEGVIYTDGDTDRPGCELATEIAINSNTPAQPIRIFVRSTTGKDIPIVITLASTPGERIRVREGPRLAPH